MEPQKASEGKIERGWRLTVVAWQLIRHDRTMLALAVAGILSTTFFSGLIFYFGGYFSHPQHSSGHLALVALVALYPSVLVSVFFNVALASAASAAFDGDHMTVREALRFAYGKKGRIALWALISAFVGLVIAEIANRLPGGARLLGWLAGAAWGLATMFVVPILAIEGIGAVDSLKRSATMVKSRWGEGLSGNIAIGAWSVLVMVPVGIMIGVGGALSKRHPGTGLILIGVGLVAVFAVSALVAATREVFAVALYRYAIDAPVGGFATSDLEYPFVPRPKRRKSWILRIGVPILVFFALLMVIFAIFRPNQETGEQGYWHLFFAKSKPTTLAIGAPVVADGRQIGEIVALVGSGSSVSVGFHIDPAYNSLVQSAPAYAVGPQAHQYLCFGTAIECGRGSPSKPVLQNDPPVL